LNGAGLELDGTPRRIYITGVGSNAILQGTANKRVISLTGGIHVTFDNITIQGGGDSGYTANGGGLYVGDNSIVVWKSGSVAGNTAKAGGGLWLDGNSEFEFMTGSISKNTATGRAIGGFTGTPPSPSVDGGGGVYINSDALFWQAGGEIANNSAAGSGGGVLVNGSEVPAEPTENTTPNNFIMSGGSISGNTSTGSVWPGGGGGVYVAKGVFEMPGGSITHNTATRQGGGVFVWSRAVFYMDGNSSITANTGVGSSKAICTRGITTLRGNAQADKVYVWNYSEGNWNNGFGDQFTLMEGARISGLVLSFADDPQNNRNYINIVEFDPVRELFFTGTDPITTIDLESRLNDNGSFSTTATIDGDWLNKNLIRNGGKEIPDSQAAALLKRFPLGSYTSGNPSKSLSSYRLDAYGKLQKK
jgi:hypothetical protein